MIFVTVGTTHMQFERFFRALERLPSEQLVVQHGPSPAPAGVGRAVAFMSFPEMLDHFERADKVVTHAGVGSILCAIAAGHTPVVIPRLKRHPGEHFDNHQGELAQALADEGKVIPVWDEQQLAEALAAAPPRRPPPALVEARPIHAALRAALLDG